MPLEVMVVVGVLAWLGIAAVCASLAVMAARGDRQLRGAARRPRRRRRRGPTGAHRGSTALR
jgi:hypothetical protein